MVTSDGSDHEKSRALVNNHTIYPFEAGGGGGGGDRSGPVKAAAEEIGHPASPLIPSTFDAGSGGPVKAAAEEIGHPVNDHFVHETQVKAVAADAETAEKQEIKAQADEPIEEEGNVFTTSSEPEERDEENQGVAEDFNVFDTRSQPEKSDEDNKGQADRLGMLAQAFWILSAASLRLIKAAKLVINLGIFKFEMPLDALWRDD